MCFDQSASDAVITRIAGIKRQMRAYESRMLDMEASVQRLEHDIEAKRLTQATTVPMHELHRQIQAASEENGRLRTDVLTWNQRCVALNRIKAQSISELHSMGGDLIDVAGLCSVGAHDATVTSLGSTSGETVVDIDTFRHMVAQWSASRGLPPGVTESTSVTMSSLASSHGGEEVVEGQGDPHPHPHVVMSAAPETTRARRPPGHGPRRLKKPPKALGDPSRILGTGASTGASTTARAPITHRNFDKSVASQLPAKLQISQQRALALLASLPSTGGGSGTGGARTQPRPPRHPKGQRAGKAV